MEFLYNNGAVGMRLHKHLYATFEIVFTSRMLIHSCYLIGLKLQCNVPVHMLIKMPNRFISGHWTRKVRYYGRNFPFDFE